MKKSLFQDLSWRLQSYGYDAYAALLHSFPLEVASKGMGRFFERLGPLTRYHHVAQTGMRLAFPEADEAWLEEKLGAMWNNVGRVFGEFPLMHRMKAFEEGAHIHVTGTEVWQNLLEQHQGAVFFSGHFANWEVMACAMTRFGLPCRITYRKANNPYFDERVQRERHAYGIKLLTSKSGIRGVRELVKALQDGVSIALLNDQKFNEGISAPFFGHDAMTLPTAVRLALWAKVPLIPLSVRREQGVHFKVTVHQPLELDHKVPQKKAVYDGVLKINQFLEKQIREAPEQWFWVHRRWPKELYREGQKYKRNL